MDRRELIVGAVGLGLLGLVSQGAAVPLTVVYDARYSDSRRYAARLVALGAEAEDVRGDAWRRLSVAGGPSRLTGLTTHSDFMVVRAEAAAAGRRLALEGSHDGRGREGVLHRLRGVGGALRGGGGWPERLAELVERPGGEPARSQAAATLTRAADFPGTLYSWLVV